MKNFIIEKPKGLKNKGNLQSISGLSAIYNGWANQDININNNFKCTKHIYCGPGTVLIVLQNRLWQVRNFFLKNTFSYNVYVLSKILPLHSEN